MPYKMLLIFTAMKRLEEILSGIRDTKLKARLERECIELVQLRLEGLNERVGEGFVDLKLKKK